MAPGGALEMIWHFAGYWHLSQDYAAARLKYDEAFYKAQNTEYRLEPDDAVRVTADNPDMGSQAVRTIMASSPSGSSGDFAALKFSHLKLPEIDSRLYLPEDRSEHPSDGEAGSSGGAAAHLGYGHHIQYIYVIHYITRPQGEHVTQPRAEHPIGHREPTYSLSYDDPPSGVVAKLTQANTLSDVDRFSDAGHDYDSLNPVHADEAMSSLVDAGRDLIPPAGAPLGQLGDVMTEDVLAHDQALADGTREAGEIEPGRYVNGELQEQDASKPEDTSTVTPPAPPEREEGSNDPGQVAETGANKAENAALILDLNDAPATLIVKGDYFSTNAILQANILQNQDHVLDAGAQPAVVDDGGNTTENIASFEATVLMEAAGAKAYKGDLKVNVDYVNGDLFDIKALTQRSFVQDSDVTVQTTTQNYTEVHTGGSEQYNVARFLDWGKNYDVIVVLGNYHSANIISQLNIVLDDDVIAVNAGEEAEDASRVFSGQNTLHNEAAIHTYGSTAFSSMTDDLTKLIESLGNRENVGREAWSGFHGTATGTLDVLFVTGDYYDLNIINQVNIISDPDVAVQWAKDGSTMQWLSSGGNSAGNFAEIIDASATAGHVIGGNAYEDSILLQANLVSDDTHVVRTDPTALVTELIAFVDHAQSTTDDTNVWTKDIFGNQHDTFGHVLT